MGAWRCHAWVSLPSNRTRDTDRATPRTVGSSPCSCSTARRCGGLNTSDRCSLGRSGGAGRFSAGVADVLLETGPHLLQPSENAAALLAVHERELFYVAHRFPLGLREGLALNRASTANRNSHSAQAAPGHPCQSGLNHFTAASITARSALVAVMAGPRIDPPRHHIASTTVQGSARSVRTPSTPSSPSNGRRVDTATLATAYPSTPPRSLLREGRD